MKRKRFLVFIVILLGITFINPAAKMAETAPIKLTFNIFSPEEAGQTKAAMDWAKAVELRSKGAVKIVAFPRGTLLKAPQTYDGVVNGIADIGFSLFAYTRSRFPVMEAVDLPMGYPSGKVATKVAHEFAKTFKPKELQDVKVLFLHAHGPGILHSKKPVRTMEDIKDMKIRATGFSAKIVEALGGIPVAMGQVDTYEALHKGIVEGTFSPMEVLKTWNQAEVIKYTTKCYSVGFTTSFFVVMNKGRWNSLPVNIQKVFEDVSEGYVSIFGGLWDALDREGESHSLSMGNKIINLSESENDRWREVVEPVIDSYIKKSPDNAKYVAKIKELMK